MSESTPRPPLTSAEIIADTNVAIDFINNPSEALKRVPAQAVVYIPSIVAGELNFGARNSRRVEENLGKVERFIASATLLTLGVDAARRYGEIRIMLAQKGRPILDNDIWIAAVALASNLPVVTRDGHFKQVDGLQVMDW